MIGTFIQTYGFWILIGVAFIFMMRMHGGRGCGMRHDSHAEHTGNSQRTTGSGDQPMVPCPAPLAGNETERQSR